MCLTKGIKVQKDKLVLALSVVERPRYVRGMVCLLCEATVRDAARYSVSGWKKVDHHRLKTLVFPDDIEAVVLGALALNMLF